MSVGTGDDRKRDDIGEREDRTECDEVRETETCS
ncbi:hypothetical protein ANO14919_121710 [Xylariales sp. No.14919]|nr:hypothetical protein ANO14919_121710 [Xylariales sp. No.14919]